MFLLDAGLRAAGIETGLVGGVEIRVGGDRVPSALTTPEATDLHALLAMMRERGVGAAAMEVSSHALVQGRVGGARYEVAVFTNLSQDHLDYHPTMQDYFLAKARLFTPEYSRVGVINLDDHHGRELLEIATVPATTFSPSGDPAADWRAEDVRVGADGGVFRVVGPGGIEADGEVRLAARSTSPTRSPRSWRWSRRASRCRPRSAGSRPCPASPAAGAGRRGPGLRDPGRLLAQAGRGRGRAERAAARHRGRPRRRARLRRRPRPRQAAADGEAAARLADTAYFTNDNPRSEDPLGILAAMVEGGLKVPQPERAHIVVEPDRAAAIGLAVGRARRGDVLVVAGKGHEQGQNVAGEVHPFDDREVVRAALRRRTEGTRGDGTQA